MSSYRRSDPTRSREARLIEETRVDLDSMPIVRVEFVDARDLDSDLDYLEHGLPPPGHPQFRPLRRLRVAYRLRGHVAISYELLDEGHYELPSELITAQFTEVGGVPTIVPKTAMDDLQRRLVGTTLQGIGCTCEEVHAGSSDEDPDSYEVELLVELTADVYR